MQRDSTPAGRVAAEIRALLARQRKPRGELAGLLGLSYPSLGRRLHGEIPFDVNELTKVAEFLEVPLSELLDTIGTESAVAPDPRAAAS